MAKDEIATALQTQSSEHRRWAEQGHDQRRNLRIAEILDRFAAPDGRGVRAWLIKHHSSALPAAHHRSAADQAISLSLMVAVTRPISSWEKRKDRERALSNVRRLAAELAELIDAEDAPPVPSALHLFDAVRVRPPLALGLGAADTPDALRPLYDQRLGPMLRSLAAWAESHKHAKLRDARPNAGSPGARVLARKVVGWVEARYAVRMPHALIADIVNIAMPDLPIPVTDENVREWGKPK